MSAAPGGLPAQEARLKRLRMRAWRRGTKEMDLILGPYADARLAVMSPAELDLFETILEENDQDLYLWVTGKGTPPAEISGLLEAIAAHARARLSPHG
ncbi:succinate dehydrogenase assembly factor 2 [Alkalilacustris brevis]|uniref:FAD assembly factor SdhE n=1 Tax=Alkalilacustris brevis TaxID=2026338 RepID=UPI000E0DECA1|nr:succinate dehydrogenase assembly factor 2 [Alkalilacustris brevis]